MDRKQIIKQHLEILFKQAQEQFKKNPKLSNEYVKKARKIAMKFNYRIPKELKRKFCKHCYSFLMHGKNARTRIHKSRVIIFCKNCKKYTRIPLKSKRLSRN